MKILLLFLLSIPILSYSQQDSGKVLVNNVIVKAKDLAYYRLYMERNNKTEDLDSIIKKTYRSVDPADGADVTVNGIERRVWRDMIIYLYSDVRSVQQNRYKRIHDALLLINDSWITDKITKNELSEKLADDNVVSSAKLDAKKQNVN
jgi:hypothetical protein